MPRTQRPIAAPERLRPGVVVCASAAAGRRGEVGERVAVEVADEVGDVLEHPDGQAGLRHGRERHSAEIAPGVDAHRLLCQRIISRCLTM